MLHIDAVTLFNFTGSSPAHAHDCWEICYTVSGRGEFHLNGKRHDIAAGDLVITAPGDSHYECGTLRQSVELFFLKIRDDTPALSACGLPLTGSLFLHARGMPEIEQVLKSILVERLEEKEDYETVLEAELTKLFVLIGRACRQSSGGGPGNLSMSELIGMKKLNVVSQVKQYIDENLDKEITLTHLSSRFFVSPQHLIRLFKAVTGSAPKQYIVARKMEHAKELLRNTSMKIGSVFEEVGYGNIHYFYRVFRKETGMTPLQYRQSVKG
jgi:AraC-like DNA-binding protein